MANFDSFLFEGHGKSEKRGTFDPGATSGSVTENSLVKQMINSAFNYLKPLGLSIHRDEDNFSDGDLAGNTYKAKAGLSVHINAGGGTGTETYVPINESFLSADFKLVENISKLLGIPNRGVKSRDYNSGATSLRTNGKVLGGRDYYKEIGDAWSRGISLGILEVGFIDTGDLKKMQSNIDKIGFYIAEYIATLCGKSLSAPSTPTVKPPSTTPPKPPTSNTASQSGEVFYRVVCGSFKDKENAEAKIKELEKKGVDAFIDIYKS